MLRMDGFTYTRATSYAAAAAAWGPDAMYVAGGTDLLPNLKHRIVRPKRLIGLDVPGYVREDGGAWVIGAGTRLCELAEAGIPLLSQAASLVAGPQIRNMGTLGGNVMLDTRCLYYNQTEFWRKSLGYCLKAEGTWCHVVGGPKTCVASQSSDTVPVLLAMDASLRFVSAAGERAMKIRELYRYNGMDHLQIEKGELLAEVVVPRRAWRGSYQKLRTRDSIDFPQLGVAIAATESSLDIVIGAASPQPKPIRGLEAFAGRPLDVAAIADLVHKQTRPQGSVHGDVAWRRQMAAVLTRRGLEAL
ncbi:MAG: FAD binding domain-containing protein [Myxococcota bacterium]